MLKEGRRALQRYVNPGWTYRNPSSFIFNIYLFFLAGLGFFHGRSILNKIGIPKINCGHYLTFNKRLKELLLPPGEEYRTAAARVSQQNVWPMNTTY